MDVVVTDKKGPSDPPVSPGTTSAVTEDDVPQQVVSFEAVQVPDQPSEGLRRLRPGSRSQPRPRVAGGRTFVVLFDDMNITPWRANEAKAAVGEFLEKGTREGDRVTLISLPPAGRGGRPRMEAGRTKLLDMVKRFDGRFIPDTSNERMSDYEAMRIHIYRDPLVVQRVLRRYEAYGRRPP